MNTIRSEKKSGKKSDFDEKLRNSAVGSISELIDKTPRDLTPTSFKKRLASVENNNIFSEDFKSPIPFRKSKKTVVVGELLNSSQLTSFAGVKSQILKQKVNFTRSSSAMTNNSVDTSTSQFKSSLK